MSIPAPERIQQTKAKERLERPAERPAPAPSQAARRAAGGSPPPADRPPEVRDQGQERLGVTNYNVAGGNTDHAPNFQERTSDLVAEQLVRGDSDVATLQEVAVNNSQNPGQDYNREIATDIFAQTFDVDRDDVRQYYLDAHGSRVRITDENREQALDADRFVVTGGGHQMTLDLESLDSQGQPQDFVRPGGRVNGDPHGATVYRAQLDNGQEYNIVFGDSGAGDKGYGNAVVLGPNARIRDDSGRLLPGSVQVTELGQDPEIWKPEADRERRTAVGVNFTTPQGQTATAISAHLTTESLSDDKADDIRNQYCLTDQRLDEIREDLPGLVSAEQRRQVENLNAFARQFGGSSNTIIGADFNHTDPDLTYHAVAEHGIDGIWGTSDLYGDTHLIERENHSDHDLLTTAVIL